LDGAGLRVGHQVDTLFAGDFDLLLGRRTYDIFAAYWPFMPSDNPIAAKFAKAEKYVLTRSVMAPGWQTSHRLADLDALAKLRAGNGPAVVIQGISTLYPQLLERGLLDRLVLMIAPITLGAGKRFFGDGTPALDETGRAAHDRGRHVDADVRARRRAQDRLLCNAEAVRAGVRGASG
jgi:dihydrofolate reductase